MFVVIFLNYQNLTTFFLKWIFSYLCMWRVSTLCSANIFDKVLVAPQTLNWLSLPNKVPRVPQVPKCPSAWVPKCLSSVRMLKCLRGQVPKCHECPGALRVPECLQCPSALQVSWVPWVFQVFRISRESKCLSKSVSQSVSHSAVLQGWFSKLTSILRATFATGETWFNFQQ